MARTAGAFPPAAAAAAIRHGMKLATGIENEKDFAGIPGLDLIVVRPAKRSR